MTSPHFSNFLTPLPPLVTPVMPWKSPQIHIFCTPLPPPLRWRHLWKVPKVKIVFGAKPSTLKRGLDVTDWFATNSAPLWRTWSRKIWLYHGSFGTFIKIKAWITYFMLTVVPNWESTKPRLCSKFPLFKTLWWILRVLPQLSPLESSLPYLRAFQWGTLWPCT